MKTAQIDRKGKDWADASLLFQRDSPSPIIHHTTRKEIVLFFLIRGVYRASYLDCRVGTASYPLKQGKATDTDDEDCAWGETSNNQ
jgi:hypothetical protein